MRSDANNCFVCGPANPIGLRIEFRMDDEFCRSSFCPGKEYIGYENMVHGGIMYSALDDVMANWIYLKGIRAFTAKCDIRYKQSLPTGTPVLLEGHCLKQKRRLIVMQGKMIRADNNQLVAETEASFMADG